jgi:3-oxoacyl-[acyl-carrier protein] reductase
MTDLNGKTVLVTGGARGIGRRYALRLGEAGADVAVADLDLRSYEQYGAEERRVTADTVIQELENAGCRAMGTELDVTDLTAVEQFVENVVDEFGSLDAVVANAGGGDGPMADTRASTLTPEHLQATVERNLYGTVYTCVASAPHMKKQESGRIITVASQAGRTVLDGGTYAHYGAAKAAVIMYTKYLAADLAPYDITVNAVAPGYIDTGKLRSNVEDLPTLEAEIPMGRLGQPEDCADVVVFLAGPDAEYVTGAVVPVDGGSAEL